MPLKLNFPVPKLPNHPVKPPRDVAMWYAQGIVVSSSGHGIHDGIVINFFNRDDNSLTDYAISDSEGLFRCLLPPNNAGYQAQPCPASPWIAFCPAFFIFKGNSPLMRFNGVLQQKDESQGK